MTLNIDHILIFKTNIQTITDKLIISEALDSHPQIEKWTVDCQDIDCVLRVISPTLSTSEVCGIIEEMGYTCDEM
jgi:hypothetical protein